MYLGDLEKGADLEIMYWYAIAFETSSPQEV